MSKHTPGPWTAHELGYEDGTWIHWSIEAHGPIAYGSIAHGGDNTNGSENSEANARLIAAAPDLLDACQKMSDLLGIGKDYGRDLAKEHEAWLACKRAIEKAEGES